jgi:hypothetical protein
VTDNNHKEQEPMVDYGTVLSNVWDNAAEANIDADCSPTKVCRNAREFTFEGIADEGEDLGTSWRNLLQREGKLSTEVTPSIRDLMLGDNDPDAG